METGKGDDVKLSNRINMHFENRDIYEYIDIYINRYVTSDN